MEASVELPSSVPNLTVSIVDGSGQVINRVELGAQPPGLINFEWDGLTDAGTQAPPGLYGIRAESHGYGQERTAEQVLVAGRVSSVALDKGGATINLGELGPVSFSKVREIRGE